jgi:tetratricopeptide (TPR) repeat protein
MYSTTGAVLLLKVSTSKHTRLDRQAVVKLRNENTQTTVWQTTTDTAEASFGDLLVGTYTIEVSAVGYLTAQKQVKVQSAVITYYVDITLEPDPSSIELNVPTVLQMPKKAAKDTQRGIAALKSGNYEGAQKRLDAAYKLVPTDTELNFLLGYLSIQQKRIDLARNYLERAVSLDSHNVRALTLLGKLRVQSEDYGAARAVLEPAVAADPGNWMAHNLLAQTYFGQKEYEKAREQAQFCIEKEPAGAGSGQLVLGQALAHLGRFPEAIQALKAFLQAVPGSPMTAQVRGLIAELEQLPSNPSEPPKAVRSLKVVDSTLPAAEPEPDKIGLAIHVLFFSASRAEQ